MSTTGADGAGLELGLDSVSFLYLATTLAMNSLKPIVMPSSSIRTMKLQIQSPVKIKPQYRAPSGHARGMMTRT